MGAVTTLVKAARHLQEEIGGFSKEFYTKNHRWTEGKLGGETHLFIIAILSMTDRYIY